MIFVQLRGPAATVRANRANFDYLIKSMRVANSNRVL